GSWFTPTTCEEDNMPRQTRTVSEPKRALPTGLAERLAEELRNGQPSGQPLIDELVFPTNRMRVLVIWDAWDRLTHEDRTAVILRAYQLAGDRQTEERIALASGLTVPEAHAAGMLPFQVIFALRKGDVVTAE